MTLTDLIYTNNDQFEVTVAGLLDQPTKEVILTLPKIDDDVTEAQLWHHTFDTYLRREIISVTGETKIVGIEKLVVACLSHSTLQQQLISTHRLWESNNALQVSNTAQLEKLLKHWGVEFKLKTDEVKDFREMFGTTSPSEDPPKEEFAAPEASVSSPKRKINWSPVLMAILILSVGALTYVLYPNSTTKVNGEANTPSDSSGWSSLPYTLQLEQLQKSMTGFWSDCLEVTKPPNKTLNSLIDKADYALIEEDYSLEVQKLIIDYSLGETPPIKKAIAYLKSQKDTYENLCDCEIQIRCNY